MGKPLFSAAASVILGAASMFAEPSCSLATLRGTYGFTVGGNAIAADGSLYFIATAGRIKSDGAGNVTGKDTSSVNGQIQRRTYSGTYNLSADCSGTMVLILAGTPTHFDVVVSPDGQTVLFIQTDAGIITSGKATRQALPDGPPQQ